MSGQFNAMYPAGLEGFLTGAIDVTSADIVLIAVSGVYVYDPTDTDVSDLTGILATSTPLTGVTVDGGSVAADPVTFAAVGPGDDVEAVVVAVDGGTLIAFVARKADTVPIVVVTDGGPITVTWAGGPVFKI